MRQPRGPAVQQVAGHFGAAPVGIQPKDALYIEEYGTTVYVPGIPSPVTSKHAFAPGWWFATIVPALLREPYQVDTYTGHVGAPGIPRSKPGFARQSYRDARFGNDTTSYMNAKAPRPTWNGLAPSQRILPVIGRQASTVGGTNDTQY